MKSLDELKSELYSKYCTLKNSLVTDDNIQQQLVSSIEDYSKFDIAVLNKYCYLDENSDDYNALALKLMVNFDEEFNKRIKEDEIFINNLKKQLIKNQESKIDKHESTLYSCLFIAFVWFLLAQFILSPHNGIFLNILIGLFMVGPTFLIINILAFGIIGIILVAVIINYFHIDVYPILAIFGFGSWIYLIYTIYQYYASKKEYNNMIDNSYEKQEE